MSGVSGVYLFFGVIMLIIALSAAYGFAKEAITYNERWAYYTRSAYILGFLVCLPVIWLAWIGWREENALMLVIAFFISIFMNAGYKQLGV